jgi:hypothetical protein
MHQNYSLGPFGNIVPGTLQKVENGEYQLSISFKNNAGKVFYSEKTHTVNYGNFIGDFSMLNRNMKAALDQDFGTSSGTIWIICSCLILSSVKWFVTKSKQSHFV